jgi:hypothetical protein
MKWIALAAVAALTCAGGPARAEDAAATSFAKFFTDVCLAKFGHPDEIDSWATDQDLPPITNVQALSVFSGRPNMDGTMRSFGGGGVVNGKAWAVHDAAGRYVLATRLDPESCVFWAQKADPADVEAAYAKMVAAANTPGANVKLVEDRSADIPGGKVHIRVHRVWLGSGMNSMALVMATVSRAGGPFQAMLETQRVFDRDEAINPLVPLEPPPG